MLLNWFVEKKHQLFLLNDAIISGLLLNFPYRSSVFPRIIYGYTRIPAKGEKAGGAVIKLQDLQERFPPCETGAAILYLVSSALPPYISVTEAMRPARRCRLVWNQNGVAYPAWHGDGWEESNMLMQRFLHVADYVFYQSEFAKRSANRFLGERKGPSEVLYNAVDTERFVPIHKSSGEFRILLAGSHHQCYRVETAINTLALVRRTIGNARLVLAGRCKWVEPEELAFSQVREMASRAGVGGSIDLVGSYSQDTAVALFGSAHVLLHTQYNDCCPRLVLEAMSCGLPVVYSASGGTPELVGADAGIGIPAPEDWEVAHPPHPEELANALCRVAHRRTEMSRAARMRAVESFDLRPWLTRHSEIFRQLTVTRGR